MTVLGNSSPASDLATSNVQLPVGMIVMYTGTAPLSGWLICDGTDGAAQGSAVTRAGALGTLLNGAYGAGNGSTTWSLPDLRNRFAVHPTGLTSGPAYALGQQAGSTMVHSHSSGSLTAAYHTHGTGGLYMPSHYHTHSLYQRDHYHVTYNFNQQVYKAQDDIGAVPYQDTQYVGNLSVQGNMDYSGNLGTYGQTYGASPYASGSTSSATYPYSVVNFIIKT